MKKKIFLPHTGMSARRTGFSSFPVSSSADELVKVTAADTTQDYLGNKIVAGTGIGLALASPGANEKLVISNTAVVTQKKRYTVIFGTGTGLAINVFIPAPTAGSIYPAITNGHAILKDAHVIDWGITVPRFTSYSTTTYTRFQLKTIVGDGSRSADITIASGINLVNYDLYYPNSGGGFNYYNTGGESGVSYPLSAGEMLFVCICAQTVNSATGAAIWVLIEED